MNKSLFKEKVMKPLTRPYKVQVEIELHGQKISSTVVVRAWHKKRAAKHAQYQVLKEARVKTGKVVRYK